jgi:hypothetical protein
MVKRKAVKFSLDAGVVADDPDDFGVSTTWTDAYGQSQTTPAAAPELLWHPNKVLPPPAATPDAQVKVRPNTKRPTVHHEPETVDTPLSERSSASDLPLPVAKKARGTTNNTIVSSSILRDCRADCT